MENNQGNTTITNNNPLQGLKELNITKQSAYNKKGIYCLVRLIRRTSESSILRVVSHDFGILTVFNFRSLFWSKSSDAWSSTPLFFNKLIHVFPDLTSTELWKLPVLIEVKSIFIQYTNYSVNFSPRSYCILHDGLIMCFLFAHARQVTLCSLNDDILWNTVWPNVSNAAFCRVNTSVC